MAYCELGQESKASFLFPLLVRVHSDISAALANHQNDLYADLTEI